MVGWQMRRRTRVIHGACKIPARVPVYGVEYFDIALDRQGAQLFQQFFRLDRVAVIQIDQREIDIGM